MGHATTAAGGVAGPVSQGHVVHLIEAAVGERDEVINRRPIGMRAGQSEVNTAPAEVTTAAVPASHVRDPVGRPAIRAPLQVLLAVHVAPRQLGAGLAVPRPARPEVSTALALRRQLPLPDHGVPRAAPRRAEADTGSPLGTRWWKASRILASDDQRLLADRTQRRVSPLRGQPPKARRFVTPPLPTPARAVPLEWPDRLEPAAAHRTRRGCHLGLLRAFGPKAQTRGGSESRGPGCCVGPSLRDPTHPPPVLACRGRRCWP